MDCRVRFFSANDLSIGFYLDRVEQVLSDPSYKPTLSIHDAIELYECYRFMDSGIRANRWDDDWYTELVAASEIAKSAACKRMRETVASDDLSLIIDSIGFDYESPFWMLFEFAAAWDYVNAEQMANLLAAKPNQLQYVLKRKKLTKIYDEILAESLAANPMIGIPIVLQASRLRQAGLDEYNIPKALTNAQFESMAKDYISSKDANSNYLAVLANKGKQGESSSSRFTLSPKTMASAKKAYDAQMEDMLQDSAGVTFGVSVCIDSGQIPCRFIKYEDMEALYSYSGKWLDLYTDNATILNNFAYIFDFVDRHWNMSIAKPGHEESFFINHVGVHYRNEFATGTAYQLEDMKQMGVLVSYNSLLKKHGASIESAITWFFNEYIADEYGIQGFRVDLPALDAAPLSKCKDIGPEIERVLKTFSMLERDGAIDRDQYSYESFAGFKAIGSLLKKPKYVYGSGEEFEGISNALFSSQTTLSYCHSVDESHDCFFDYLVKHEMIRSYYDDGQLKAVDYLVDKGFLKCDEENGRLVPTLGANILKRLWTDGVISYCELHSGEKVLVDSLIDDGFLETESTLFNRLEADYLSYMFDDREFANALAIRNRYSHSPDISTLPNDNQHETNYLHFLQLLVGIVLKINYELLYAFGNGDAGIEFMDWELDDIDEATVRMLINQH